MEKKTGNYYFDFRAQVLGHGKHVRGRQYAQCAAGVSNYSGLLWEQMLVLMMQFCKGLGFRV